MSLYGLTDIVGRGILGELEEQAHVFPVTQGGEELLKLIIGGEGGDFVTLIAEVLGGGIEDGGEDGQLRRVRLGLMLLPVLTESGAAAKGLRDEFLRDALRPAEGIKPFIIEQKNHPIYVHNDKSQKRGSRHWKILKT